ncbi:MAG: twin-arginine translocase TatA/TatE family subunit [Acidobacteriaceae bacterium]
MPSFPDSIFLFVLALLLFGPKRLPVLARELGKWVGEFRRASNEFKMQMEEELRLSEQAERNRQIAAIAATTPVAQETAPTQAPESSAQPDPLAALAENEDPAATQADPDSPSVIQAIPDDERSSALDQPSALKQREMESLQEQSELPITVSGDLKIMPPNTRRPRTQQTATPIDPGTFDFGMGEFGMHEGGIANPGMHERNPMESPGSMPSVISNPVAETLPSPPETDSDTASDHPTSIAERALHGN